MITTGHKKPLPDVTPSGIKGGQGRDAEDVEQDGDCLWILGCGILVALVAWGVTRLVIGAM